MTSLIKIDFLVFSLKLLCFLLQTARTIVIALEQKSIFEHFLPDIIGPDYMRDFNLNLLNEVSF